VPGARGGFCMGPVIVDGATVQVQSRRLADVKKHDIMAYFIDSKLLVHRVLDRTGDFLTMRGDSESSEKHQISFSDVLGW